MTDKYIKSLSENTAPDLTDAIEIDDGVNSEYMTPINLYKIMSYPHQGVLLNGQLSVTVASNNLTVAIKGRDGNDPSATNPVHVRIGNTVRTITAALSVTKNAATNWCNAGSAELATKEIDYFVYLGYNATDGVVIGFSRIPYANQYSDFSATTTNEKYCAISTITNAAAGDYYENIGRFAATLSAGAGYTWSVPTFTASNLINRPIYETRMLTWTPTITGFSGTPTVDAARYQLKNGTMVVRFIIYGTSNDTAFTLTIPFTTKNLSNYYQYGAIGYYQDNGVGGAPGACQANPNTNIVQLYKTGFAAWTNSGSKQGYGTVDIEIN